MNHKHIINISLQWHEVKYNGTQTKVNKYQDDNNIRNELNQMPFSYVTFVTYYVCIRNVTQSHGKSAIFLKFFMDSHILAWVSISIGLLYWDSTL